VLFNEPKLLKWQRPRVWNEQRWRFSALQRAEIAEIRRPRRRRRPRRCFSALQRAEIAEIVRGDRPARRGAMFQCSSTSRNC